MIASAFFGANSGSSIYFRRYFRVFMRKFRLGGNNIPLTVRQPVLDGLLSHRLLCRVRGIADLELSHCFALEKLGSSPTMSLGRNHGSTCADAYGLIV